MPTYRHRQPCLGRRVITVALLALATSACGVTGRLASNLNEAVLNQDDLETVRFGAPAYMLMVDGLISGDPEDADLLMAGARLYGAYSSAFVRDVTRNRRLSTRALDYARRAMCRELPRLCAVTDQPYPEFEPVMAQIKAKQVPVLYTFATAWAGWVQAHSDDWNAIAQLPKIEAMMRRIVALDETYDGGAAHIYLGVLANQLPPSLGGRPEEGRRHFERAIELSGERNLMAKVLYARHYARMVFDRDLHDRLLREVLSADAEAPGLTLINILAQEEARELLEGSADYF